MYRTETDGRIKIEAAGYTALVSKECIEIILDGECVAALSPVSSVTKLAEGEAKRNFPGTVSFDEECVGRDVVFTWRGKTDAWDGVSFNLRACERYLEYNVTVKGRGDVDAVEYFIGGDELRGSEYEFDRGFTPIPTVDGASQCEFAAGKSFDECAFLTIPPIFTYVFDTSGISKKAVFALAARRG